MKTITFYRRDFKVMENVSKFNSNYSAFDDLLFEVFGMDEQKAMEVDQFSINIDLNSRVIED